MKEAVYSLNCEEYYDSVEEALDGAIIEFESYPATVTIYVADKKEFNILDFINAESIIENAADNAAWQYEDHDWLADVSDEAKQELSARISAWAEQFDLHPNFYGVRNVRAESITIDKLGE